MTKYTYGDTALAGERLSLVADLFASSSRAFLRAAASSAPDLAVDLGCGPGHTTRLVHAVTGAERTLGLDRSAVFIAKASSMETAGVSFVEHDVTKTPLPVAPSHVVFARLLLAHLPAPTTLVGAWLSSLAVGGRLLLDEVESVETEDRVMQTYLRDVAIPVITKHGGRLLLGPSLHEMPDPPRARRVHDEVVSVLPPVASTARMFGLNLRVLALAGEIRPRPDLEEGLASLASGEASGGEVVWRMRQIAFERR
jgi:trans-aconitate 2-methyltransferase